jgi:hypothetical protein
MRRQSAVIIATLFILLFLAGRPYLGAARASAGSQGKQLLSADQIKLMFFLMDTDRDGKISKQEWMSFMGSTFDQLDQNKTGKLDPKELSQLTLPGMTFASNGK